MKLLLNESIDRVLNIAINNLIEYVYNGKECTELIDSYNLLLDYIEFNHFTIENEYIVKFNRLKEIVSIVTGKDTHHSFDDKNTNIIEYTDLDKKINILNNDFKGLQND